MHPVVEKWYLVKLVPCGTWSNNSALTAQIAKFMAPTWGPPGSCRPQMGPMLAPWTLLSRCVFIGLDSNLCKIMKTLPDMILYFFNSLSVNITCKSLFNEVWFVLSHHTYAPLTHWCAPAYLINDWPHSWFTQCPAVSTHRVIHAGAAIATVSKEIDICGLPQVCRNSNVSFECLLWVFWKRIMLQKVFRLYVYISNLIFLNRKKSWRKCAEKNLLSAFQ